MPRRIHHTNPSPVPQLPALLTDDWQTSVVPQLPPDVAAAARTLKAFQRVRGLPDPTALLRGLLAYVLCASSFQTLGVWAVLLGLADLSDTAWRKRLRTANAWLLWLLGELLAGPPLAGASLPGVTTRVLLVDATRVRQRGGCGDDWRVHTAYDLRHGRLAQLHVTDRHGGETLGRFALQPQDLVVCDSGYGHRGSVATVVQQQADLITRICPTQFPLTTRAGMPLDTLRWLRRTGPAIRSRTCSCTYAGQTYTVRLVAVQLPPAVARANRRRIRQRAKQQGRTLSPTTIFLAGWVLLITTLDAEQWGAAVVAWLYRARWQIELVFKRMQQMLDLGVVRSTDATTVEATVRARLVAWALQAGEAVQVRKQVAQIGQGSGVTVGQEVVSSWLVTSLCLDTLRQQVRGQWTLARVHACLPQLARFVQRHRRASKQQETTVRAWLDQRVVRLAHAGQPRA